MALSKFHPLPRRPRKIRLGAFRERPDIETAPFRKGTKGAALNRTFSNDKFLPDAPTQIRPSSDMAATGHINSAFAALP